MRLGFGHRSLIASISATHSRREAEIAVIDDGRRNGSVDPICGVRFAFGTGRRGRKSVMASRCASLLRPSSSIPNQ